MLSRRVVLLVVALFLVTLLVRFPARWAAGALPTGIVCSNASGTIWTGRCSQLEVAGLGLSGIAWQLHPMALLSRALDVDVRSSDPRASGTARVRANAAGRIELRQVDARLSLAGGLIPQLKEQWSGEVQLQLPAVDFEQLKPRHIDGTVRVLDLRQRNPVLEFGSYELVFRPAAGDDALRGALRDLQGPLAVVGELQLRANGEYELNGTAAARADASDSLQRLLELLGPADVQGSRPFSLAGTL